MAHPTSKFPLKSIGLKLESIWRAFKFTNKPGETRALATRVSVTSIATATGSSVSPPPGSAIPATLSGPIDHTRVVLEVSRPALRLGGAIASGIPGVGAPVNAAINSLLIVLDGLYKSHQNRADIQDLRVRMRRLLDIVDWAGDNARTYIFIHQLKETEGILLDVQNMSPLRYEKISEVIKSCADDVNNYINEYTMTTIMELRVKLEQQHTLISGLQTPSWSMYLVDPMGNEHQISMDVVTTLSSRFQKFQRAIGVLYEPDSPRDILHRRCIDANAFHLGIYDGRQVTNIITDIDLHELVKPGTKIVMSFGGTD
ncbi:hypothetical protein H0H92_009202 [Tricholoma furcatifolium]|nr:hypothetical protein H0H92_009202 [Tricholoma furcatifolium]